MPKEKIWNIKTYENMDEIENISHELGITVPTACLLYGRGYKSSEEAKKFLRLETEFFHDPALMPDMDKAVNRICKAIESGEKAVVYGDYDVDGVTSVSLLYLYLKEKGLNVSYYIPNRVGEGYGVNKEAIKKLSESGNTLIITVDTGVTAIEEAEYAKSIGCDMVITDHHECREELPSAVAVVNPRRLDSKYPFPELAGVGVAFKVVCGLEFAIRKKNGGEALSALSYVCSNYIDLVALGTVADVMPLKDENRLIVSMGLKIMEDNPRYAITSLLNAVEAKPSQKKKAMSASVIGYTLAPRINAAGRMASATRAVELFLSKDKNESDMISAELCEINRQRQEEENKIADELKARIEQDQSLKNSAVIVLENDGWLDGVIGIVSSRITEKYGKPSILISFDGDNGKGSGRSIKGLNLVEALNYSSEYLIKYGGHELAAGLSIKRENLEAFKAKINEYAKNILGTSEPDTYIDIDCELDTDDITLNQALETEFLEPCGTSNPTPTFVSFDLKICDVHSLGAQGRHTKLILEKNGKRLSAVMFGTSPSDLPYAMGQRVDIAFRLNVNEYMGIKNEQVLIRDIRLTQLEKENDVRNHKRYEDILQGKIKPEGRDIPLRADFVSVYLHLKRNLRDGGNIALKSLLQSLIPLSGGEPLNYVKLRFILDILNEMNIIKASLKESENGRETFIIKIPAVEAKVDLNKSCIYRQLLT